MSAPSTNITDLRRRGFTLTELMVAVAVLIGVLLAVGKIFSTTSKVTSAGRAAADVLQELPAIESQLRADIAAMAAEGVLAIRCVAVPNDVNGATLLNPNLEPDAIIRADQLVFLMNTVNSVQSYRLGAGVTHPGEGTIARVYYGHAYQLGAAGRAMDFRPLALAADPYSAVYPWSNSAQSGGQVQLGWTRFEGDVGASDVFTTGGGAFLVPIAQVDARKWLLSRQMVLMVDDDTGPIDGNNKTVYLGNAGSGGVLTARSLFLTDPRLGFTPQLYHGRMDASAMQLNELRQVIQYISTQTPRDWRSFAGATQDQYGMIADQLLYYPRAERIAPSQNRIDQALTNHVLGNGCSSIRIDWTYADGTGFAYDGNGTLLPGVDMDPEIETRWFGMPALWNNNDLWDAERGVGTFANFENVVDDVETIFSQNVERIRRGFEGNVDIYEAVFGFNRDQSINTDPSDSQFGQPDSDLGYTPWPSAIRVTLTLHDSRTTMEGGREVQFVIDLPKRTSGR